MSISAALLSTLVAPIAGSTDLYAVEITAVAPPRVELTVTQVYLDDWEFPTSTTFALSLVYDPILDWRLSDTPGIQDAPLARELDLEDMLEPRIVRAEAAGFIDTVTLVRTVNHPMADLSRLDEAEREAFYADRGRWPRAEYRVVATHPGWVAHLEVGMRWSTTSYDMGPAAPAVRRRFPGDWVAVVADDRAAGMMRSKPKDHAKGEVETAWVARRGPRHYAVKDKLSGPTLTERALNALLGEPLLYEGGYRGLQVGTLLAVDGEHATLYSESSGGWGRLQLPWKELKWVGRAWWVERRFRPPAPAPAKPAGDATK